MKKGIIFLLSLILLCSLTAIVEKEFGKRESNSDKILRRSTEQIRETDEVHFEEGPTAPIAYINFEETNFLEVVASYNDYA